MADAFAPRSMKRKNVKGLALTPAAPKPPPTAENANLGPVPGAKNDENTAQLEIGIEFNLDLKPEDLEIIKDLGAGNGGSVSKVRHIPTNTVMARKVRACNARLLSYFPLVFFILFWGEENERGDTETKWLGYVADLFAP
jgi:hypothetical protein